MSAVSLYQFLEDSFSDQTGRRTKLWLSLCLVFAAIPSLRFLFVAFSGPYVVQNDARQIIFWMRRWLDPELFPDDMIADYYQSISSLGFQAVYWLPAQLGVDPFVVNKLLPIILSLALAYYAFKLAMRLLNLAPAAFLASTLTVLVLSGRDIIGSGTPRAFAVPLLVAFLFYLARRKTVGVAITMALLPLFYPPAALVALGVLWLSPLRWEKGPRLELTRAALTPVAAGTAIGIVASISFVVSSSEFGPTMTLEQARTWPTFLPGARNQFFMQDGTIPILCNPRSGFLPPEWGCHVSVPLYSVEQILLAIGLSVWLFSKSLKPRYPRPRPETMLLVLVFVVGTLLFAVAHWRLFELYLASRYSQYSLRATTLLALGLVLGLWFERGLRWAGPVTAGRLACRQRVVVASAVLAILGLLITHWFFPRTDYLRGSNPELYRFFAAQPKDSLIASLSVEADNLPTFSQRSVLTSREYSIAWNVGYITPLRERTGTLISAFLHPDIGELRSFLADYGVDFVLVDRADLRINRSRWWVRDYPRETNAAASLLEFGGQPAILDLLDDCAVFKDEKFAVLPTECIAGGP